ncbi:MULTISPECIES: peptidoglycan-binding protein [unclassified Streptomyces]|jgi:LysM repeat protein|uniref:peptidoglycan-binding protein n=1 Tax=unclassified Streptomyces TaxID=2593676 RepID=UPI00370169CA
MTQTPEFYVVREGDTLSAIAARFHVSLAQILNWNPQITNPDIIHPRQRIRVSAPTPNPVFDDEPFPGKDFFQPSVSSPIIEVMGWRLIDEGCSAYADGPDFQWSEADRKSYAMWQRKLGFSGSDADGIPGRTSWEKLHVPALPVND